MHTHKHTSMHTRTRTSLQRTPWTSVDRESSVAGEEAPRERPLARRARVTAAPRPRRCGPRPAPGSLSPPLRETPGGGFPRQQGTGLGGARSPRGDLGWEGRRSPAPGASPGSLLRPPASPRHTFRGPFAGVPGLGDAPREEPGGGGAGRARRDWSGARGGLGGAGSLPSAPPRGRTAPAAGRGSSALPAQSRRTMRPAAF